MKSDTVAQGFFKTQVTEKFFLGFELYSTARADWRVEVTKISRIQNADERLTTLRGRVELLLELRQTFLATISAELPGVYEDKPQASADLFKWFEAKQVNSAAEKAKVKLEVLDEMLSDFLAEVGLLSGKALKHPGEKSQK